MTAIAPNTLPVGEVVVNLLLHLCRSIFRGQLLVENLGVSNLDIRAALRPTGWLRLALAGLGDIEGGAIDGLLREELLVGVGFGGGLAHGQIAGLRGPERGDLLGGEVLEEEPGG